jgi:hypothetical protein
MKFTSWYEGGSPPSETLLSGLEIRRSLCHIGNRQLPTKKHNATLLRRSVGNAGI